MKRKLILRKINDFFKLISSPKKIISGINEGDLKGNEEHDFSLDKNGNLTVNLKNRNIEKAMIKMMKELAKQE